jgi:hypothetical protein
MRILLFFTLLLLSPAFLFSQGSIAGSWKMKAPAEDGSVQKIKFSFEEDGTYTVDFGMDGVVQVRGKYQMDGNRITIWDVDGEFACPSEMKGVYELDFTDDGLNVTKVSDGCPGRGNQDAFTMKRL